MYLFNNVPSPRQIGFGPGTSTQEALLYATDDWYYLMDRGLSVASVFFDLSKAFDRVPHGQLITTLRSIRPSTSGLVLQLSLKQISESGPGSCCNLKSSPGIYSRPLILILYADDIVCTCLLRHTLMLSLYKLMLTRFQTE